jgi:hypothetical protein
LRYFDYLNVPFWILPWVSVWQKPAERMTMPKRRVKERRKRAQEFKRLVQVHGGRKGERMTPTAPPVDKVGVIGQAKTKQCIRGGGLARNQTGKRKAVVIIRERNGRSLPAVFRTEGQALSFVVAETRSDIRCLVKRSGFGVRRY